MLIRFHSRGGELMKVTRLLIAFLICANPSLCRAITLDFNSPSPGTLNDTNGLGSGFTHRLPGSGSSIATNDPNLTLDTGASRLLVVSTRSDFNTTGKVDPIGWTANRVE
jgi:hypothetical protein